MGAHEKPLDHHQNCKHQNPVYSNNRGQSLIIAPNAPEPLLRDDDGGKGGLCRPTCQTQLTNIYILMYLNWIKCNFVIFSFHLSACEPPRARAPHHAPSPDKAQKGETDKNWAGVKVFKDKAAIQKKKKKSYNFIKR